MPQKPYVEGLVPLDSVGTFKKGDLVDARLLGIYMLLKGRLWSQPFLVLCFLVAMSEATVLLCVPWQDVLSLCRSPNNRAN